MKISALINLVVQSRSQCDATYANAINSWVIALQTQDANANINMTHKIDTYIVEIKISNHIIKRKILTQ